MKIGKIVSGKEIVSVEEKGEGLYWLKTSRCGRMVVDRVELCALGGVLESMLRSIDQPCIHCGTKRGEVRGWEPK